MGGKNRRIRITSEKIKDAEIQTVDLKDLGVTGAKIAATTIPQTKNKIITQVGTVVTNLSKAYKVFPLAFSAAPEVMLTPGEAGITYFYLDQIPAAGSFEHYGSAAGKVLRWMARGSA